MVNRERLRIPLNGLRPSTVFQEKNLKYLTLYRMF